MANWLEQGSEALDTTAASQINSFIDRFDMSLPHYRHSRAAIYNWEPVYLNQFDVIITPPSKVVKNDSYSDMLVEQIKKLDGMPELIPTSFVEQKYMWATRSFSKPTLENSSATLEIQFEVNLNNKHSMYVYETIKSWAELQFSPEYNLHGLKGDYSGEMTVLINNKTGKTIRQTNFFPVYLIEPINALTLDYLSEEIYVLTAKFKADYFVEKRIKPANSKLA